MDGLDNNHNGYPIWTVKDTANQVEQTLINSFVDLPTIEVRLIYGKQEVRSDFFR